MAHHFNLYYIIMSPTDHTNYTGCYKQIICLSEDETDVLGDLVTEDSIINEWEEGEPSISNEINDSVEEIETDQAEDINGNEVNTPKTRWSANDVEMRRSNVCRRLTYSNVCRRLQFESEDESE